MVAPSQPQFAPGPSPQFQNMYFQKVSPAAPAAPTPLHRLPSQNVCERTDTFFHQPDSIRYEQNLLNELYDPAKATTPNSSVIAAAPVTMAQIESSASKKSSLEQMMDKVISEQKRINNRCGKCGEKCKKCRSTSPSSTSCDCSGCRGDISTLSSSLNSTSLVECSTCRGPLPTTHATQTNKDANTVNQKKQKIIDELLQINEVILKHLGDDDATEKKGLMTASSKKKIIASRS